MNNHFFLLHAITNLHVGSGDTIGIVDKTVQRDHITQRPIIHGSSLKGALREFCQLKIFDALDTVFGKMDDETQKTVPGYFNFFSAHLVSMPFRSDRRPYFNATCPDAITELIDLAERLDIALPQKDALKQFADSNPGDSEAIVFERSANGGSLENLTIRTVDSIAGLDLIGPFPSLVSDKSFSDICKCGLPVIPRNRLESGESANLWYEEVVPRESRFIFGLIAEDANDASFRTCVEGGLVQIGGNASVGYGFTKIRQLV
ncbi:MAG: type III-B CRISPR module RAMP protein Cmr4 [Candidatus Aminicenantes bacterium]|nr:type III-B CRISPR module RAMP protein Cmr4 [Candidatus Aminicenantes bacterium]